MRVASPLHESTRYAESCERTTLATMMKSSACSLLLVLLVVLVPTMNAGAEKPALRIAGGLPGGTYSAVYARNLAELLRDYSVLFPPSSGSGENLELLADGAADLAFAQADVYAAAIARDPQRFDGIQALGRVADECIFVAYRKSGPVTQWGQLTALVDDRSPKVAVGRAGGGMSGSWEHLVGLEPGLLNAKVDHTGDTLAINQLAIGKFDAVAWVTDPKNLDHKMTQAAIRNKDLALMDLTAPNLVMSLPDGTQVYRPISIPLGKAWRSRVVQTVCTNALLLVGPKASDKLVSLVSDYLSLHRDRIVSKKKP